MKLIDRLIAWCSGANRQLPRERVVITDIVLNETLNLLRAYHDHQGSHEGIVYWAGLSVPGCIAVTSVIAPDATTTPGSFTVGPQATARAISFAVKHSWRIVAQVHSHPGSSVEHSLGDDQGAFLPYPGYMSVVVPYYAHVEPKSVVDWGFHIYTHSGFGRMEPKWIGKHVLVLPDGPKIYL
jgi:proteasome lid subunit RPN8/RPN11